MVPTRISFIDGWISANQKNEAWQTYWLGLSKITLRFISTVCRKINHLDYLFEYMDFLVMPECLRFSSSLQGLGDLSRGRYGVVSYWIIAYATRAALVSPRGSSIRYRILRPWPRQQLGDRLQQ